jgi:hypothetical protein
MLFFPHIRQGVIMKKRGTLATMTLATVIALGSGTGGPGGGFAAAAPAPPRSTEALASELTRLAAEVREQRALIMNLMRLEQEHYNLLLRMLQGGKGEGAALPGPPAAPSGTAAGQPSLGTTQTHHSPVVRTAAVRGKVVFGGGVKDVYVYSTTSRARRCTAEPSRLLNATSSSCRR